MLSNPESDELIALRGRYDTRPRSHPSLDRRPQVKKMREPTLIIGDERSIPFAHALFIAYPENILWAHALLEVRATVESRAG